MRDLNILAGQFLCDESIVVDSHKLVVQLRPHPPYLQNKLLAAPTVEMISWEKKFLISPSREKVKEVDLGKQNSVTKMQRAFELYFYLYLAAALLLYFNLSNDKKIAKSENINGE